MTLDKDKLENCGDFMCRLQMGTFWMLNTVQYRASSEIKLSLFFPCRSPV